MPMQLFHNADVNYYTLPLHLMSKVAKKLWNYSARRVLIYPWTLRTNGFAFSLRMTIN